MDSRPRYAPTVDASLVARLSTAFGRLRDLAESAQAWEKRDEAKLSYPYSARELVKICQHLDRYGADGVDAALANVFCFDAHVAPLKVTLDKSLKEDGFRMCNSMREDDDENFAEDERRALRKLRKSGAAVDPRALDLDCDGASVAVVDRSGGAEVRAATAPSTPLTPRTPGVRGARPFGADDRAANATPKRSVAGASNVDVETYLNEERS